MGQEETTGIETCPRLETDRLVLGLPSEDDIEALVRLANNREIADNLATLPHPFGAVEARNWIIKSGIGDGYARFAIYEKSARSEFIGAAGFGIREANMVEIGYWIGQPFWERGFATEAARAVIDFAFTNHAFDKLHGACRVTNEASRRVLIRCGFQYHCSGMTPSAALGGSVPVDRYHLDRSTWASLRGWKSAVVSRPTSPSSGAKVA